VYGFDSAITSLSIREPAVFYLCARSQILNGSPDVYLLDRRFVLIPCNVCSSSAVARYRKSTSASATSASSSHVRRSSTTPPPGGWTITWSSCGNRTRRRRRPSCVSDRSRP